MPLPTVARYAVGVSLILFLLGFIFAIGWIPLTSNRDVSHPLLNSSAEHQFIFFGFSTCLGVCPMTLDRISKLDNQLLDENIQVIYIEIEKHNDNLAARQYAKSFHKEFVGIAPSESELEELKNKFMLAIRESGESVQHLGKLYLVKNKGGKQTLYKTYSALTFNLVDLKNDISNFNS